VIRKVAWVARRRVQLTSSIEVRPSSLPATKRGASWIRNHVNYLIREENGTLKTVLVGVQRVGSHAIQLRTIIGITLVSFRQPSPPLFTTTGPTTALQALLSA
jgi:hypothetical protein